MPVLCSLTSSDDSVVELPSVTLLLFSRLVVTTSVELSLSSREVTLSGTLGLEEITEDDDDSPSVVSDVESDSEDNVVTLSASSRRGSTEVTLSTATVGA